MDLLKLAKQLHVYERKVLLAFKELGKDSVDLNLLMDKTSLKDVEILRALQWLGNKELASYERIEVKQYELSSGINELPELKLLKRVIEMAKKPLVFVDADAVKEAFNDQEFNISIGALKRKNVIAISKKDNKLTIAFMDNHKDIVKQLENEQRFLHKMPIEADKVVNDADLIKSFVQRNLIKLSNKSNVTATISKLGKDIYKKCEKEISNFDLLERIDENIIKTQSWKNKEIRAYDVAINVPKINGGKRHFVNQATDYAKQIWLDMGFKEMTGSMAISSFWNFDALFTAQDHPVREMQDTFFIKGVKARLPTDKKLIANVKKAHEDGVDGSIGWNYTWNEETAKKVLLRTHTTCISSQMLKKIADTKEFPAKYFALGKCFRNETVDWSHGFEFNQTEGIVIDENANFRQLLGYLKLFFKKMGYDKIRIRPSYFPYTEPSLEIDVWHPIHNKWFELGGAGMFRPEVTVPIFGRHVPVLAWGPGFDRIIMEFFKITDLRDMYKNNLTRSRETRFWLK